MSSGVTPIPNGIIDINETKILTFGEELIGIEFSTEEDSSDYKVKKNIADIVNILKDHYNNETKSASKSFIFDHAIGELISAQTAVSKLLNTK